MKASSIALAIVIPLGMAVLLVAPGAERAPKADIKAEVKPISKTDYKAAVGPLLDDMATLCGEAFDAKKFRIGQDANGLAYCEPRKPVEVAKK